MTSDQRRSFERQWPDLADALQRSLARRGVPAADRDDIVQDTALRLLRAWDRLDHSQPLLPLAHTIALNLVRDNARKQPHREVAFENVPEQPAWSDVERESLGRLDLQRVANAMEDLSPPHRLVLLQEVDELPRELDRTPAATKMLRMRARRRLCMLLETASAIVGLAVLRLRRAANEISHSAAGTLAAVAFVAALPSGASAPVPERAHAEAGRTSRSDPGAASVRRPATHVSRPNRTVVPTTVAVVAALPAGDDKDQELKPVTVPVGDSEVGAGGSFEVNDVYIEVSDRGGPVPVCTDGIPGAPDSVDCPD